MSTGYAGPVVRPTMDDLRDAHAAAAALQNAILLLTRAGLHSLVPELESMHQRVKELTVVGSRRWGAGQTSV